MKKSELVKVVVFVPKSFADAVRNAIGDAGAGKIGNYDFCSFTTKGVGRFSPLEGANPVIGEVGKIAEVREEKIEFLCPENLVSKVYQSIKKAHPYEEVALDVYPLINYEC